MIITAVERALLRLFDAWRRLSLDAKVIGALGVGNWLLLLANHTTVHASRDDVLWRLFPGAGGPGWLLLCGALALAYPLRDLRQGTGFTARARWVHLGAIVTSFVLLPAVASIVLRETGRPYTYVHDGAIMVEEAARKLWVGQNPYVADYLDTPLFFWPMVNNPALYHLAYFPFLFLVTMPFVRLFDALQLFWDQRYLFLPAFAATLALAARLVTTTDARLALVAAVALNPQLFPFVVEGRNDFFVLVWLFAGVVLLQRGRERLALLALALGVASKLHAMFIVPFVLVYLVSRAKPAGVADAWRAVWRPAWPAAATLAALFLPFLVNDFGAFYDDIVRYNGGGAAWSYPISGVGFSAILLGLGLIPNRQADFPFAAFQLALAVPIGWIALRGLWREPTLDRLLLGYAATLLAFLFFGRYFHGNYAGFIVAVATPALFLRGHAAGRQSRPRRNDVTVRMAAAAATRGDP